MKLDTIGKNIRKFRLARKLRQEDLAEKTDLTTNYIGMVERGEKIPSLETFIKIVNALGVSSDMVLTEVLETGYTVKNSMLNEKLEKLAPEDRNRIYEVTPIVFVGGGAVVMKNFGSHDAKNISYNLDVKANARGYEQLATMGLKSTKRLS